MTAIPQMAGFITPEEYWERERTAKVRHEYLDGYMYAMPDVSADHNRITVDISTELLVQLRGHTCEPFASAMKLKIPPSFASAFYYPDVMVACDPTDNHEFYRERPSIVFEVLSPETERIDRHEKAVAYRHIPGIRAYLLVEQGRMAITVLHAAELGWSSEVIEGPEAVLKLPVIDVEIPLARIYERTSVAAETQRGRQK